ncbi:MAG: acetolactate synthase small subunit [Bacteroidales bacterium]|nr:acetolactate synthase small subunit [Bacteroidales bacterium]
MNSEFTLSLFTENHIGVLNQVTNILTRRQINIESITASESAVHGVHLITLVVITTEELVSKVAGQMEKLIDVIKVFVHTADEIIHEEVALYKVGTKELMHKVNLEQIVRENGARILEITPEYAVIECTGHKADTSVLFEKLRPYGILQFARSGRVAITKQQKELVQYLEEMDAAGNQ